MNEFLNINPTWYQFLKNEFSQTYFESLQKKVQLAYSQHNIYPPQQQLFNAFNLCAFNDLKIVLLGQDPYHGANQANGLSFSVNKGIRIPPSLKNIFKEMSSDVLDFNMPQHGDLTPWAQQGVLLLNAVLSVEANQPGSHKSIGWETFTDHVIEKLSTEKNNLVFMLWGNYALQKAKLIDENKHLVLKAAHPSPLARGAFFGSKHFSKANTYLQQHALQPINWQLNQADLFNQ